MINRAALRVLLLATSAFVPSAAFAQATPTPSAQTGTADAIRVLLDQAAYWRGQSNDDKANVAVSRVLVLDPNNADALAIQAQSAADLGDQQIAKAALAKLQAVRPDDPRIPAIQQALKIGPAEPDALAEARALSEADKPEEAIAAYRKAFKSDTPPPALAAEYYQVMMNTKEDWSVPRAGLAAVLRSNPENLNAQLAYADLLTYHEETREEGIKRLSKLAQNPAIAASASKDMRQALLWLDVNPNNVPQYDIYLASHPGDLEIAHLAETARSNTAELKAAGFYSLDNEKLEDADQQFTEALRRVPTDPDAMIGLGLTRWRQNRISEGRDLLKQAILIDPSKAADYQRFVDAPAPGVGVAANTGFQPARTIDYGREARRRIQAQYRQVTTLTNAGEFDKASALLKHLSGSHPSTANLAYLADIEARAGRLPSAEAKYRAVLAKSPRNVQAIAGLAAVLSRNGQQEEADKLFAQAAQLPGGAKTGTSRSNALRLQAEQMSDPVARIGLFRSAVNADPNDPWIRLELARALLRQHDEAGAEAAMAPVAAGAHPSPAQMQAAIYFANENHDNNAVVKLVDRLPPAGKTAPMLVIRTDAQTRQDLMEAKALGSEEAQRNRLLALASQPDPTGTRVSAYASELIKLDDKAAARDVVRLALAARPATAEQRVAYGAVLLSAGYSGDARRITQVVTPTSGLMTQKLGEVRDGAAVVTSDRLNAAGFPAEAYDQLAPRLATTPDSPDLNLALARLYTSNKQAAKAVTLTDTLLEQNPSNLQVRSSAVYARLADGNYGQAASVAEETTVMFPDEPQAWVDFANVERARGHTGAALKALQTAKTLRQKQLSSQEGSAEPSVKAPALASAEPLRRQYALYIPPNTATDALPEPAPEPVSREYSQYNPDDARLPIEPLASPPVAVGAYAPFTGTPAPVGSTAAAATAPVQPVEAAPVMMTQNTQSPASVSQGNPFHPGSSPLPTIDEPTAPAIGATNAPIGTGGASDAMTAQIDLGIQQISEEVAPRVEGSLLIRGRTGASGFERLIEVAAPIEASFSPSGYGRLSVSVTPTYLYSGRGDSAYDVGRYGTNALGSRGGLGAVNPRNQTAFGSALDVGYAYDMFSGDVGATPLGFRENNVVGGIQIAPRIAQNMVLRILAERRAVTDSVLSYAGMKDYRTGETWGGVTRNHGHIQVDGSVGLVNYYAGAGGGVLLGHNVASNTEYDAGAGATYPVWRTTTQEVRVGTNLVYFGYDKNLSGFSLGQGGYFSPEHYYAILFPVTYRDQYSPDLRFSIGGSVGYQTYNSKSSDVFPNNSALQAQLVAQSATSGVNTKIGSSHGSGLAGGVNGDIDYRVNGNLHIGSRIGFDHSGSFSEGTGLVYARYIFNDTP